MKRRKSIEYGGTGQSGYAAGRHHDLALDEQVHTRNPHYPHGQDDDQRRDDLHTDDRWTGRGRSD